MQIGAGWKPSPGTAGSQAISAYVAMVKQSDVSTTWWAQKMPQTKYPFTPPLQALGRDKGVATTAYRSQIKPSSALPAV